VTPGLKIRHRKPCVCHSGPSFVARIRELPFTYGSSCIASAKRCLDLFESRKSFLSLVLPRSLRNECTPRIAPSRNDAGKASDGDTPLATPSALPFPLIHLITRESRCFFLRARKSFCPSPHAGGLQRRMLATYFALRAVRKCLAPRNRRAAGCALGSVSF